MTDTLTLPGSNGHGPHRPADAIDGARDLARVLAGKRAVLTAAGTAWSSTLSMLSPLSGDQRWRDLDLSDRAMDKLAPHQLLDLLSSLSPTIAKGLSDFQLFCNPGIETLTAYYPNSEEEHPAANRAINDFWGRLADRHGAPEIVMNRLFTNVFLRGALLTELATDRAGRVPLDLLTPDPIIVKFEPRSDPDLGTVWMPGQRQQGKWVSFDVPTIRYLPINPLPGSPYGRAIAGPALFPTLFGLGFLRDVRRVIAQAGMDRIDIVINGEALRAMMSPEDWNDPDAKKAAIDGLILDIQTLYRNLQPEDAWTHTDVATVNRAPGAVNTNALTAVDGLMRLLKGEAVEAMGSMAILHNMNEGTTETNANRQMELQFARIRSVQHLAENLMEYNLNLGLQMQGIQAKSRFRFAELRSSEELRDAQTGTVKANLAAFLRNEGFIDQAAAAKMGADVDKPAAPGPLVATAPPRTPDETVDPEPGVNR